MNPLSLKFDWDRLGVGLSGLCVIHCLVLPIMVSLLPLYPVAEDIHEWSHPILLILIIPAAYFSLRSGNATRFAMVLLISGVMLLLLAWGFHDAFDDRNGEFLLTLSGSIMLITGHWLTFKNHTAPACAVTDDFNSN